MRRDGAPRRRSDAARAPARPQHDRHHDATPPSTPRFDTFYRHDALTAAAVRLRRRRTPAWWRWSRSARATKGATSGSPRVTNIATGAAEDKPAFWADGNIHAAELTASTAVLYYLHQLVDAYGTDRAGRQITHLLDTRTIYLCPRLNPDGAELALADRPRHIRSSTRRYPYDEDAGRRPDGAKTSTATAACSSCASPIRTAPTSATRRSRA